MSNNTIIYFKQIKLFNILNIIFCLPKIANFLESGKNPPLVLVSKSPRDLWDIGFH